MKDENDLVVIGGGPAGSLLASLVAQQGYKVTLLEKESFPIYKIGESLLPSINQFLELAGLKSLLSESDYVLKRGGTFRWGKEADLFTFNFKNTKLKHKNIAYQVRRCEFDEELIKKAREKGVRVLEKCNVLKATMDNDHRINGVEYEDSNGEKCSIRAKIVADTSGVNSKLAKEVGKRTFSNHYQHVAVFGYFKNCKKLLGEASGNTLFESFQHGWCWYFPVHDNLFSVGALISKDKAKLLSKKSKHEVLQDMISETMHIKQMMTQAKVVEESPYNNIHVRSDFSYCHDKFWRPGLVLVGDSAAFVDVLLSSGVHLATYAAILASRSILSYFDNKQTENCCFDEYEIRYKKEYGTFYKMLASFYDQDKNSAVYNQELQYWFGQTNALNLNTLAKERKSKLLYLQLGHSLKNADNVKLMRSYIEQLLTCINPSRDLSIFPATPLVQTELIPTKSLLKWESI